MDAQKGQEAFLDTIANKLGRPRRSGVTPPRIENQLYNSAANLVQWEYEVILYEPIE